MGWGGGFSYLGALCTPCGQPFVAREQRVQRGEKRDKESDVTMISHSIEPTPGI